ncbi:MAG: hypothetical protein BWY89_00943 [Bacteroidetes bacterium ADurb.BinA012]|nr:MAG: hypothetical protein BWY89_00943 [Bacteroidetes bacterium ADurb.BinA012]
MKLPSLSITCVPGIFSTGPVTVWADAQVWPISVRAVSAFAERSLITSFINASGMSKNRPIIPISTILKVIDSYHFSCFKFSVSIFIELIKVLCISKYRYKKIYWFLISSSSAFRWLLKLSIPSSVIE